MRKYIISGLIAMLAGNVAWAGVVWTIPMTGSASAIYPTRPSNWDGTDLVVTGSEVVGSYMQSFRWSKTGGNAAMPAIVGTDTWAVSQSAGISNDGSIIAGVVYDATNTTRYTVKSINGGPWSYILDKTATSNINNISGNGYYGAGQRAYIPEDGIRIDDITGSTTYVTIPNAGSEDMTNCMDVNDNGAVVGAIGPHLGGTGWIYNGPHNPGSTMAFAVGLRARPDSISDSGDRILTWMAPADVVTSIHLYDWDGSGYSSTVSINGLPGYTTKLNSVGMSHDGLRFAGRAFDASNNWDIYLWDNGTLMNWSEIVTKWGLTMPGTVTGLTGISPDGNVLTGTYSLGGTNYGFAALIPEPGTLSLLVLGGLAAMRRRRR